MSAIGLKINDQHFFGGHTKYPRELARNDGGFSVPQAALARKVQMTGHEYEAGLEDRIIDLHIPPHRGAYPAGCGGLEARLDRARVPHTLTSGSRQQKTVDDVAMSSLSISLI